MTCSLSVQAERVDWSRNGRRVAGSAVDVLRKEAAVAAEGERNEASKIDDVEALIERKLAAALADVMASIERNSAALRQIVEERAENQRLRQCLAVARSAADEGLISP